MRRGPDAPKETGEIQDWKQSRGIRGGPPWKVRVYGFTPNIAPGGFHGYYVEDTERTRPWGPANPKGWQKERLIIAKAERDPETGEIEGWTNNKEAAEYHVRRLANYPR